MFLNYGKLAFDRITNHEVQCEERWQNARVESQETRQLLADKFDKAMQIQTAQIEKLTSSQNRLFLIVSGSVISLLISIIGMILHKDGML